MTGAEVAAVLVMRAVPPSAGWHRAEATSAGPKGPIPTHSKFQEHQPRTDQMAERLNSFCIQQA